MTRTTKSTKTTSVLLTALCLALPLTGCARNGSSSPRAAGSDRQSAPEPLPMTDPEQSKSDSETERATFAAGCFWCVEAVLEQLEGVSDVTSGYMGGTVLNPSYKQVCTGETGHAEVVQVTFDPRRITYRQLLDWFWKLHDPTTLNRQGNDVGTQYRSAIFFHTEQQQQAALQSREAAGASGEFHGPIVTEITAASRFYPGEVDHQEYYRLNKRQPYCRAIIAPKLRKLGLDE